MVSEAALDQMRSALHRQSMKATTSTTSCISPRLMMTPDQGAPVQIAHVPTPAHPGPQPLPAGMLPSEDRCVRSCVGQQPKKFLGASARTQETHRQ